jgi:hypothetical protein
MIEPSQNLVRKNTQMKLTERERERERERGKKLQWNTVALGGSLRQIPAVAFSEFRL